MPPTFAQPSFSKETHSPDIFMVATGMDLTLRLISRLLGTVSDSYI